MIFIGFYKILNEKELKSFKVTKSEFNQSDKFLSDSLKNSILIAYANIKKYHQKQLDGLSINNLEKLAITRLQLNKFDNSLATSEAPRSKAL